MDKLLDYLSREPVTAKKLLANPALDAYPYNSASSYLHECYKKGLLLRSKDNNGEWQFSLPGAEQVAPPPDDGGLPPWAIKPQWTESEGDAEGHWRWRKPGHRCWWTARWCGGGGVSEAKYAIENGLTPQQAYLELEDNAMRGNAEAAIAIAGKSVATFDSVPAALLKRCRESYQEFCGMWAMENVRFPNQRPGWNHVLKTSQHLRRRNDGVWILEEDGKPDIFLSGPQKQVAITSTEARIAEQLVRKAKLEGMGIAVAPQVIDGEQY